MHKAAEVGLVVGGSALVGTGIWYFFFRKPAAPQVAAPAPTKYIAPAAPKAGKMAPIFVPTTKPYEAPKEPTVDVSSVTATDRWNGKWNVSYWLENGKCAWMAMFTGAPLGKYQNVRVIRGTAASVSMVKEQAAAAIDNWCGLMGQSGMSTSSDDDVSDSIMSMLTKDPAKTDR